ncbi:MAG TPA: flagellar hook assembly protein FlgD [Gammaproteobacteria bacterium]|nr:flagellar hook assembly protein FlgD [Gammaproteobacteria bacterium]
MISIQDTAIYEELGLSRTAQSGARKTELGQDDFLKLMTTQLKNQDPMKPMENGEFMGQLAQFGTVSGIEEVRTELQNLSGSLVSNQSLQAAAMLGRQVLIPGSHGVIETGGAIDGAVDLPNAVTNLNIGIYDLSGQLIRNVSLGNQSPGMVAFNWDGLATDGSAAPPGRYAIRAEAISGGRNEAYDVMLSDTVQSVSLPAAGRPLALELTRLGNVSFSDIRQIS